MKATKSMKLKAKDIEIGDFVRTGEKDLKIMSLKVTQVVPQPNGEIKLKEAVLDSRGAVIEIRGGLADPEMELYVERAGA
jgi:hypothetical protein